MIRALKRMSSLIYMHRDAMKLNLFWKRLNYRHMRRF